MRDPATFELRQPWDRQTLIEAIVLVSGAAGCMTPGTASRLRGTAHRRDSAGGLIAIRVAGLVYVALLLAASPAWALKPSSPDQPLGTLKRLSLEQLFDLEVTSVSQKPESLSQAAAAIHVVIQDEIRRLGTLSIPELLRDIPGVEVARVSSRDYAITARGFNGTVANKLLVMIDGRSVYTPLYSGVFWDAQDTFIQDIEQIEVIRGPGATVWGANAVNGVINVRSKPAAATQGLLVDAGGGDAERGVVGARYGGGLGSHAFYRLYGKKFERAAAFRPNGSDAGDEFGMTQGGARLDWAPPGPDEWTLQGDVYGGSADQPTAGNVQLSGGNGLAQWRRHFSAAADLELRSYYDHTDRTIARIKIGDQAAEKAQPLCEC